MSDYNFIVKNLGLQPYLPIWKAMKLFIQSRTESTADELWLLEHEPVFTLGQAGKAEHVLNAHDIPVIKTDRGGQVTYHGPGQLMAYCLFDLNYLQLNSREFVCKLEQSVIELLAELNIKANGDRNAPGVYVNGAKIASLGLRIRKGFSYHGLCLNVCGNLKPFSYINPCGIKDQTVTSLKQLGKNISINEISNILVKKLLTISTQ